VRGIERAKGRDNDKKVVSVLQTLSRQKRPFRSAALATAILCIALPSICMSEPQITRGDIETIIHDYILAHPEVIIEALQSAQRKQDEQFARSQIQAHKDELLNDPNAVSFGNLKGDVTLVEFFDYRCPYCRQMEPTLRNLVRADPGLRIVKMQFPILGPQSILAARAALAAKKQGKHQELHDAFMTRKSSFDEASILSTAETIGLDVARLKSDMASPEVDAEITKSLRIAKDLKLNGTPAFIVGDELIPGATDLETLVGLVDDARHKSR